MAASREQILEAADQIAAEGQRPTLDAVRKITGGSYSTISPVLNEWKAQQKTNTTPIQEPAPDTINDRLAAVGSRSVGCSYGAVKQQPMTNKFSLFNLCSMAVAASVFLGSSMAMSSATAADDGIKELKKVLEGQIALMKPELQKKVKGLSMDTKMSLMTILAMHSRYSERVTMRQVMTEVLADFQSVMAGIMTDNPEMTVDSARRLANHRIPVGGLLPYLGMENISDERLATLVGFNDSVEGNSLKLAEAAEKGDMGTAAEMVGKISVGCVACHSVFRGQPGVSDLLR